MNTLMMGHCSKLGCREDVEIDYGRNKSFPLIDKSFGEDLFISAEEGLGALFVLFS